MQYYTPTYTGIFQEVSELQFPHQNAVCISLFPRNCYRPFPTHFSCFGRANNICLWVKIARLPTLQVTPLSVYFLPPLSKYLSQKSAIEHPQPSSLNF
jgi:hypothetical protein